jgi:hypothetical protein
MGRQEPSGPALAPQAYRKEQRAKVARLTINKTIPALLASDVRARNGVERAELIVDPQPIGDSTGSSSQAPATGKFSRKRKGKSRGQDEETEVKPEAPDERREDVLVTLKIKIKISNTLAAARVLHKSNPRSRSNVAILNMASPLRPGGGVLNGATSQEESLCTRTTLLPSLKEEWYRLPEIGAAWSPDVCVFRVFNALTGEDEELGKSDRFYVDAVSAGMLRFPEVITRTKRKESDVATNEGEESEGEEEKVYANDKDREVALNKIRAVMRVLQAKRAERVVLGAWGCGAYANPVREIVAAWKKVLLGNPKKSKGKTKTVDWSPVKEIVFAIKDAKMAEEFAASWGSGIEFDRETVVKPRRQFQNEDDGRHLRELQEKIRELELQIPQVRTPLLKRGLEEALQALRPQLAAAEGSGDGESGSHDEELLYRSDGEFDDVDDEKEDDDSDEE